MARPVTSPSQPETSYARLAGVKAVEVGDRVKRTMRLSIIEGGLVQVLLNWTSGSVLVGYLFSLGATSTHIALVGSVPFLAQVASPFGAWAAEVLGRR